jgi:hypothetical protein
MQRDLEERLLTLRDNIVNKNYYFRLQNHERVPKISRNSRYTVAKLCSWRDFQFDVHFQPNGCDRIIMFATSPALIWRHKERSNQE